MSLLEGGEKLKLPQKLYFVVFMWVFLICSLLYISLFFLLKEFLASLLPFLLPFTLTFFLFFSVYIFLLLRSFRFRIKENILHIKSGLVFRKDKRFNLRRMVCIKTISTPFMRILKLKVLLITFEGSIHILPPVSADFAEEILDNTIGRQGYEEV